MSHPVVMGDNQTILEVDLATMVIIEWDSNRRRST